MSYRKTDRLWILHNEQYAFVCGQILVSLGLSVIINLITTFWTLLSQFAWELYAAKAIQNWLHGGDSAYVNTS